MPTEKTKLTVGLFVAGGIIIAMTVITWLGMSRFLEKGRFYVTYLNESVQGLDKDSPVKYRGVTIGRVEKIRVAPDSKLIEVILKIESGQKLDSGMVAHLSSVGITGSMIVELDRKVKGEPVRSPYLSFPSEYPIVSSKPSDISELKRGFDDVMDQIRSMDLDGVSERVKLTLDHINRTIDDADVKGLSENAGASIDSANKSIAELESTLKRVERIIADNEKIINNTIQKLRTVAENTNKLVEKGSALAGGPLEKTLLRVEEIVADNEETIKTTLRELKMAMANANKMFKDGSSLVSGTDKSLENFNRHQLVIAQNLEKASENLNRLVELISQQPSQLIFGQPPARRDVESNSSQR